MKIKSQRFGTFPFPDQYDVVLSTTLNKTDLTGGNNKYYQIEGHSAGGKFRLFSRYGRVGHHGVAEERIPQTQDLASLEAAFDTLKAAKTGKRKGYVEVMMASTKIGSDEGNKQILSNDIKQENLVTASGSPCPTAKITLPPSVVQLVNRLFTEAGKAVQSQLSGSLQTTAENPLGTLTLTQIETGRTVLQEIQKLLTRRPKLKGSIHKDVLNKSNEFYSAIPQTMDKRPTSKAGKKAMESWLMSMSLNNETVLDEKEDLLGLLSDVQGMVGGFATTDADKKYTEIGCKYDPIEKGSPEFKKIERFILKSRSGHHSWSISISNIWSMSVKGQRAKHVAPMKKVGNVNPLFHGSRSANILGICKHGLLMRPPGVYVTGSMFGNGLYFADQSSKSEQYSFSRFGGGNGRGSDSFFMFITDVALGKVKQYGDAQMHLSQPPRGYGSVQGKKGRSLMHNEFIIYSLNQHILQYLIEFKTKGSRW